MTVVLKVAPTAVYRAALRARFLTSPLSSSAFVKPIPANMLVQAASQYTGPRIEAPGKNMNRTTRFTPVTKSMTVVPNKKKAAKIGISHI
jgi:hypothetical protein